jgi:hypothetical protein
MVTISAEAIAKVERFVSGTEPMDWFLIISWRKGAADNHRRADGAVAWTREPDAGWVVDLGGWKPGKVPPEEGLPLHGKVRVLIQPHFAPAPFPGGEIYVEADEFKVRTRAI